MKSALVLSLCVTFSLSATIAEINGNKFVSLYAGKAVRNVQGLVTAVGPDGFWLQSTQPDSDSRTSEGLYVYANATKPTRGDIISLNGRISTYRSSSQYLFLTELASPTSVKVISSNNTITPLLLGSNSSLTPPIAQYTYLDNGNPFSLPANSSQISTTNPTLQPSKYGLDFYQSLVGELVAVNNVTAISKASTYDEIYITGAWPATSRNSRGGLTITATDNNVEGILIGAPLDGTKNPDSTVMGARLSDITGVLTYAYGTYRILPLTAFTIISSPQPANPPVTSVKSTRSCQGMTIADYNIENFSSNSTNLAGRAEHIVRYLGSPDLIFLQEVQDSSGPTDDGTVDVNMTLTTLIHAIADANGPGYAYVDINPSNDEDGGQPGGNIRQAYLYNPAILDLSFNKPGNTNKSASVTNVNGIPTLNYNPVRIDPLDPAWHDSRKPLVAQWTTLDTTNSTFFTINLHLTAKLGSSPLQGDLRPPINGGVDQRVSQINVTSTFINSLLSINENANVIVGGDCNEFSFVQPLKDLMSETGLRDVDDVVGLAAEERYTYLFGGSTQELDHFFVSQNIAGKSVELEHVHVNTWVSLADEVSDHDPTVMKVDVCS